MSTLEQSDQLYIAELHRRASASREEEMRHEAGMDDVLAGVDDHLAAKTAEAIEAGGTPTPVAMQIWRTEYLEDIRTMGMAAIDPDLNVVPVNVTLDFEL